ncbi:MAG: GNAT family N-acetyltransferase [Vampirovibrionales bacterium]|nr:GNAT family N-acetyltransferase [Vampirovibrionales bacterium]
MDSRLITCRFATSADIGFIQATVRCSWETHFKAFLTDDHIRFDMQREYGDAVLRQHLDGGPQTFWIAQDAVTAIPLGFVATERLEQGEIATLMIHKVYLDAQLTGQGIGSQLMAWLRSYAVQLGCSQLMLMVNRYNRAKNFYEAHGFVITEETDTQVGESETGETYWRNDYRMVSVL